MFAKPNCYSDRNRSVLAISNIHTAYMRYSLCHVALASEYGSTQPVYGLLLPSSPCGTMKSTAVEGAWLKAIPG